MAEYTVSSELESNPKFDSYIDKFGDLDFCARTIAHMSNKVWRKDLGMTEKELVEETMIRGYGFDKLDVTEFDNLGDMVDIFHTYFETTDKRNVTRSKIYEKAKELPYFYEDDEVAEMLNKLGITEFKNKRMSKEEYDVITSELDTIAEEIENGEFEVDGQVVSADNVAIQVPK